LDGRVDACKRAGSTWWGVHIEELAIEIGCYLEALPRGAYRRQLHTIFTELLEFHRTDLDDSVIPLVGDTLAAIDPDTSPSLATLAELEARWRAALDGLPARTYNALSLCRVLGEVRDDLESGRPWMGRNLAYAIVGDDIRPQTPTEIAQTWVPKVANDDLPEVRMLRRFIASALQALDDAGVPRPQKPEWLTSSQNIGGGKWDVDRPRK
jgi:hypothetical protein